MIKHATSLFRFAHRRRLVEREAVLARRRADAAELGRRQRRASRRARARLAPITAPGPVTDTTIATAEQARRDPPAGGAGRGQDSGLRRLAMTNLLELKTDFAYWNPDLAEPDPTEPEPDLADLDAPDVDSGVVPGTGTDEMTGSPVEEGQS